MNVFKMSKGINVMKKVMMLLVVLVATTMFIRVNASGVSYPFATGEDAFKNAPTWSGDATAASGDTWQYLESNFPGIDLSAADKDYYVAVEIKATKGNPGFTVGILNAGNRYGTYIDGNPLYTVTADGTIATVSVLYGSINIGSAFEGMLVIPLSSLAWVSWANTNKTLANITGVFIETNARYNWDFALTIGEIGVYEGNFQNGGTFTKIKVLSSDQLQNSYYNARPAQNPLVFPEIVEEPTPNGYPFGTGEEAFKNAATWTGDTSAASADTWQYLESNFPSVDLSAAGKDYYVAVEIKATKGNPGFTVGLLNGANRYGTYIDGNPLYTVKADGSISTISVLYSSINIGSAFEGMLVIPVSSLAWVGWAATDKTLAGITGVFIETNAKYNWDFQLTIGEIGVYEGDFRAGGVFTEVKDLSTEAKEGTYYNARPAQNPLTFPVVEEEPVIVPIEGKTIAYPFRTGELAYKDAVLWNGVTQTSGDEWQTLTINFAETDMTNATYIAVQYGAKAGVPGMTYGLQHLDARYSIAGIADGQNIYMVDEAGLISLAAKTQYSASNISSNGMLLIPMSSMGWQFGTDANKDLAKIHQFLLTTNAKYNWNYEIIIGEMGYYTGTVGEEDFTFHKLIDLSNGNMISSFNCAGNGRIGVNKIDQKVYGDTVLEVFGTNKNGSDFAIWNGGSYGEVTMGTDTYGDEAMVMTSKGVNPTGDAYTAITLADGIAYDWSYAKGVTLWARNDSDTEVSFNIQLDCLVDVDGDGTRDRGRFNIRQGYQFWLYDVNTGKDTIYMTRPEIALPVGFEGWVRVPFEAFLQADWSLVDPAHKVIPREYFMSEGSVVGYLAITIDARDYTDKTFAVNKLGCYTTTPVLATAIIKDDSKSIRKLMGLE